MNKSLNLFDEDFVKNLFRKEVLPLYPRCRDIVKIEIKPYKKMIWTTTYHVVASYEVFFLKNDGKISKRYIVCSAHSDEPRENVFKAMNFLWKTGFRGDGIDMPRPLFFSPEFNGAFYRGLRGENILRYIKDRNFSKAEEKIILAAKLLARLHSVPTDDWVKLNPASVRIKTVVPGVEAIKKEMSERYDGFYDKNLENLYSYFIKQEEEIFSNKNDFCLIHGDAHLENIIDIGPGKLGLIDLSDICRADFARDLGTFMQQLEYKILTKVGDKEIADRLKKLFLEKYLSIRKIKLDDNLQKRINLYYNWTMVRTATYLFLKHDSEPERGADLFNKAVLNIQL
jgi:thiamine kinase-like enzyme